MSLTSELTSILAAVLMLPVSVECEHMLAYMPAGVQMDFSTLHAQLLRPIISMLN